MSERRKLWLAQPLGDCQHCRIDESQSQIGVALKRLPDAKLVLVQQGFDPERPVGTVVEERLEGVEVGRGSEQILELDERWGGHDANLAGFFEEPCARLVMLVARLDRRDEHARVYDETQGSGSYASSPASFERSVRSERPTPDDPHSRWRLATAELLGR